MNSDSPHSSRDELEARITALLLGELSAAEAATMRRAIEQDAELAQLYERLERTINLVQEAAASPIEDASTPATLLKLSEGKRQRLLQSFKTAAPKEFTAPRHREMPWFIPMSIAAAAVAMIGSAALLPGFWSGFGSAKIPTAMAPLSRHENARLSDSDRRLNLPFQNDIAKNAKGVSLPHEQSASGVNGRTALDVASASPAFGGIVLPFAGDSANSPEGTVTPEAAAKPSPASLSRFGRGGGGGGGGVGGGGGSVDSANFSFWKAAPTVTTASPDSGRRILDFATRSDAPQEPQMVDNLASNNREISKGERNTFSLPSTIDAKPIGVLGVPEAIDVAGAIGAAPISAIPSVTTIDPSTGLPISAQTPRLNEDLKQRPQADGALALGETPALGDLFQAKKNIAAGAEENAPPIFQTIAPRTPAKDTFGDFDRDGKMDSLQAGVPGRSAGGATGKIDAQAGTAPSVSSLAPVADRSEYNLAPLPVVSPRIQSEPQSDFGVVTASSAASTEAESLTRRLAVPLAQGPRRTQLDQPQSESRNFQTPLASKKSSLQKEEKLSELGTSELAQRSDANGEQSILAKRGEQDSAKTDSRMMRRYGLKPVGVAEANSIAAATPGEQPQSMQQSIVLTQKPSDEVENRSLSELDRDPKGTARGKALTYFEKKRELEGLKKLRDGLSMQATGEEVDAILAKSGVVNHDSEENGRRKHRLEVLNQEIAGQEKKIVSIQQEVDQLREGLGISADAAVEFFAAPALIRQPDIRQESEQLQRDLSRQPPDSAPFKPAAPALIPQPEIQTGENAFSTFSLNVSDVSFKLAAASLDKGVMPEPATVRSEEFINAFDYRDSEPPPGVPVAFAWERTRYPFAHNRDLLRFSIKTAAEGRQPGRSLNLVLLLDNSGSMERADRVRIVREALRVLAGQLQPQDKLSVIAFARNARLWADGVPGNQAREVAEQVSALTPQGGTNLEEAMNLAYQTALRHYVPYGVNRVVLLTDGAANLGNVNPAALTQRVETYRKQGIALDCFGIGWEGYNDDLLEVLSRHGDGRYGFINTPEATTGFAGQLAGALRVAASDVKLQVEFNPKRVTAYRQIGYAKHQLTKEQFRDNTVDAAEIGAAESGNALYVVEVNPRGEGQLSVVRVRFKVPGTTQYREQEWIVPYTGTAVPLEQASSAMRLAATASAFSEWLVSSPYAAEVTPDRLLGYLNGVPAAYGIDPRPKQLESMIRQAKSVGGR